MATGDGKVQVGWVQFAMNNLGNIISTITVVGAFLWLVAKPHAEVFITDTVELKLAGQMREDIEEGKADREIIKTDQRAIRENQKKMQDEQRQIKDDVKAIRRLLERRQ